MALQATLFRFRIDLSDIDRGVYEQLDFRAAMHPSESPHYLVTRVLALALNTGEGVAFAAGGLSDPDAPCIQAAGEHGGIRLWIEIGNPSARKLHKAAKAAPEVKVYTYKDPLPLLAEIKAERLHRADSIEIYSLAPKFLEELAERLERDNSWTVVRNEGALLVSVGEHSAQAELNKHRIG